VQSKAVLPLVIGQLGNDGPLVRCVMPRLGQQAPFQIGGGEAEFPDVSHGIVGTC
jgi:hypothetical protein